MQIRPICQYKLPRVKCPAIVNFSDVFYCVLRHTMIGYNIGTILSFVRPSLCLSVLMCIVALRLVKGLKVVPSCFYLL